MSLQIAVIVGSTRPGRTSRTVADWLMQELPSMEDVSYTLVDLAEIDLPFYDETIPAMMRNYENDHTKKWSKLIEKFDAFIVVTPEYNHGYPAVLKNAFDYLNHEWRQKPITFVSYGSSAGGSRAVEQLRLVAVELHMAPIREQILIPFIWEAIDQGKVKAEYVKGDISTMVSDLVWWGRALQTARAKTT